MNDLDGREFWTEMGLIGSNRLRILAQSPRSPLLELLARGAGIALVIQVGGYVFQYASQVALARWLGAHEFGGFAFGYSWAQTLAVVAGLGFPMAALRFIPEYSEQGDNTRLWKFVGTSRAFTFGAGLVVATLGTILILLFGNTESDSIQGSLIWAVWVVPILSLSNLHRELIRAAKRMALAFGPAKVLYYLLVISCSYVVIRIGGFRSSEAGIISVGCSAILILALQVAIVSRVLPGQSRTSVDLSGMRPWLAVAVPLLLAQESIMLLNQADIMMLGFFRSPEEVAYYTAAARTGMLGQFALLAVNAAAAPMIAGLHARGDRAELQRLVTAAARWSVLLSAVMCSGLVLFSTFVLQLFGPEFVQARWALWIIVAAQFVNASTGPVGYLLSLTGYHVHSAILYGLSAIANILLNLMLIPAMGINGAAIATLISMVGVNVVAFHIVRKKIGVRSFGISLSHG